MGAVGKEQIRQHFVGDVHLLKFAEVVEPLLRTSGCPGSGTTASAHGLGACSGWLNRSIMIDCPRKLGFLRTLRSMVEADSV